MALNWTVDSTYKIQNGAYAWPQQLWSNPTTCWRPALDFNIMYMAFATNVSNPNAPPLWRMYQELEPCCSGDGNMFVARADCKGVACMTNDRKLVEDWSNCTRQRLSGFETKAIQVNYTAYEKQVQIARAEKSAAPSRWGTKVSVVVVYALASVVFSALL